MLYLNFLNSNTFIYKLKHSLVEPIIKHITLSKV